MIDATTPIVYSYDDFCAGISHISNQVKESGFQPDYIVGVVRGGAIPASYLSHKLKLPVVMVSWNTRDELGNDHNCWIPEDLHEGKKVLIVDDIVDGGETIKELLEDWFGSTAGLGELPVDNIRVASMWYNPAQEETVVDFYHHTIDRNVDSRWIIFPWEA